VSPHQPGGWRAQNRSLSLQKLPSSTSSKISSAAAVKHVFEEKILGKTGAVKIVSYYLFENWYAVAFDLKRIDYAGLAVGTTLLLRCTAAWEVAPEESEQTRRAFLHNTNFALPLGTARNSLSPSDFVFSPTPSTSFHIALFCFTVEQLSET
jgi:hypothetical protein